MFSESLLGYKLVLRTINLNIAFTVGYMKCVITHMSPVIVVIQHYSFFLKTHQAI